jgi:hypothetical protein
MKLIAFLIIFGIYSLSLAGIAFVLWFYGMWRAIGYKKPPEMDLSNLLHDHDNVLDSRKVYHEGS